MFGCFWKNFNWYIERRSLWEMSFLFLSSCMVWRRFGSLLNIFIIYIQQNFSHVFSVTIRPSKAKTGRAKKKKISNIMTKIFYRQQLENIFIFKKSSEADTAVFCIKKLFWKKFQKPQKSDCVKPFLVELRAFW